MNTTNAAAQSAHPSLSAVRAARIIVSTVNLDSGRHLNEAAVQGIAKIIDRESGLARLRTAAEAAVTQLDTIRLAYVDAEERPAWWIEAAVASDALAQVLAELKR